MIIKVAFFPISGKTVSTSLFIVVQIIFVLNYTLFYLH